MKKIRHILTAIFTATSLSGCMYYVRGEQDAILKRLEINDAQVFHEHGYEIVKRRGYGRFDDTSKARITEVDFYGYSTDMCYTLRSKDRRDKSVYGACVRHSPYHPVFQVFQEIKR